MESALSLLTPFAAQEGMPWWVVGAYIFVVLAVLILAGIVLKFLVRKVGIPCQFCDARLQYWDDLSMEDCGGIMEYFTECEKRSPDTDGVFVCPDCGSVFDDFSGAKLSRDYDAYGIRAYCKVCNNLMWNRKNMADWDGVSESPYMHCEMCGSVHQWQTYKDTRFRFLVPPEDKPVLPKCEDFTGHA